MGYSPPEKWKQLPPKDVVAHPVTSVGQAVSLIVLHHSVTNQKPFFRTLRAIDRFHHNGDYLDFAYNGAASNVSDDYTDGRGPLVQGGATGSGVDSYSLSICVIGSFHLPSDKRFHKVTDFTIDNVASLIARWMKAGHVSPNFEIDPHRLYYQTACCGDALSARIPDIMARVDEIMNGGTEMPTPEVLERVRQGFNRRRKEDVAIVQDYLRAAGLKPGRSDGVIGPMTERALQNFNVLGGVGGDQTKLGTQGFARLLFAAVGGTPPKSPVVEVEVEVEVVPDELKLEIDKIVNAAGAAKRIADSV